MASADSNGAGKVSTLKDKAAERAGRTRSEIPASRANSRTRIILADAGPDPEAVAVQVALARAMRQIVAITKGDTATIRSDKGNFSYAFRSIDDLVDAAGAVFRENGLIPVPIGMVRDSSARANGRTRDIEIRMRYRLYGPMGDFIEVEVPGEGSDIGEKATRKAASMAYRIFVEQMLCIPFSGDVDADRVGFVHGDEAAERQAAKPAAPTPDVIAEEIKNPGTGVERIQHIAHWLGTPAAREWATATVDGLEGEPTTLGALAIAALARRSAQGGDGDDD